MEISTAARMIPFLLHPCVSASDGRKYVYYEEFLVVYSHYTCTKYTSCLPITAALFCVFVNVS